MLMSLTVSRNRKTSKNYNSEGFGVNHVVFDKPNKVNNFTNNVARLGELGLASGYHHFNKVSVGDEREPTHYWRDRTKDGWTYHIDHAFLPNAWLDSLRGFTVGQFEDWIQYSDHMPLIMDIDNEVTCDGI